MASRLSEKIAEFVASGPQEVAAVNDPVNAKPRVVALTKAKSVVSPPSGQVSLGSIFSPSGKDAEDADLSQDDREVLADETAPGLPGLISLIDALNEIASAWFGREIPPRLLKAASNAPTPETLTAIAREIGLEVTMEEIDIGRIESSECPCLVVEPSGMCRIITGRPDAETFQCQVDGNTVVLARRALAATQSGVVFHVRPKAEFASSTADGTLDPDAEHPEDRPVESVLGFLIRTMLKRKAGALFQVSIASAVSSVLIIVLPIFSMAVYDRVLPHMAFETLWALTIGMAVALAADLALRHVKLKMVDSIAADIGHVVQVRFFKRLLHGQIKGLPRTGGALAQTIRDLESYCQLIPNLFLALVVDVPFVVITSIILAGIAGTVALVPIGGAIVIALTYGAAHMVGRARLAPYLALLRVQSNTVIETIDGMETVKTATAEQKLLNRWERLADATAYGSHRARVAQGFAAQVAMTVSQAMTVAALILGVYEISQNAMTVGALSASTMLIGRLISPISQFIAQYQRILQAKKTLEPIRIVLNAPMEQAGDRDVSNGKPIVGHIEFRSVGYSYPGAQSPSVSDVSFTVRPGERIGIIGRVGSGKSTLLRLLTRMHDPDDGVIRLDGNDIRQTSPRTIRKAFAYMKQDTGLFDDTLRANLLFGLDRPDPKMIEVAVQISGVASFAARNPEGFGMRVGPRGERLSGGERQAVGLARAMIGNPSLLLLDEPTSSMDNTIERHIINNLKSWLGQRTLIVATHRAAMLDLVDRVILMNEGKIVADGPKDEVLRKIQSGN